MSSYGPKGTAAGAQYNQTDNLDRKATRTGAVVDGIGPNKAARAYTSSGFGTAAQQAATTAKEQRKLNRQQPVKVFSEEEKRALQAKLTPPALRKSESVSFAENGQWTLSEK